MVMLGARAGMVRGGRQAGEIAEVVDEVGLIGIAMTGGDVAPIDGAGIRDGFEDALQAAYACETFGREADVFAEVADKGLGEESEVGGHNGNR